MSRYIIFSTETRTEELTNPFIEHTLVVRPTTLNHRFLEQFTATLNHSDVRARIVLDLSLITCTRGIETNLESLLHQLTPHPLSELILPCHYDRLGDPLKRTLGAWLNKQKSPVTLDFNQNSCGLLTTDDIGTLLPAGSPVTAIDLKGCRLNGSGTALALAQRASALPALKAIDLSNNPLLTVVPDWANVLRLPTLTAVFLDGSLLAPPDRATVGGGNSGGMRAPSAPPRSMAAASSIVSDSGYEANPTTAFEYIIATLMNNAIDTLSLSHNALQRLESSQIQHVAQLLTRTQLQRLNMADCGLGTARGAELLQALIERTPSSPLINPVWEAKLDAEPSAEEEKDEANEEQPDFSEHPEVKAIKEELTVELARLEDEHKQLLRELPEAEAPKSLQAFLEEECQRSITKAKQQNAEKVENTIAKLQREQAHAAKMAILDREIAALDKPTLPEPITAHTEAEAEDTARSISSPPSTPPLLPSTPPHPSSDTELLTSPFSPPRLAGITSGDTEKPTHNWLEQLTSVDLSGNSLGHGSDSETSTVFLTQVIGHAVALKKLHLADNALSELGSDHTVETLMAIIVGRAKTLATLDLADNHLSAPSLHPIKLLVSLEELNLAGNEVPTGLSSLIKSNALLRELQLPAEMSDTTAERLITAINAHPLLEQVTGPEALIKDIENLLPVKKDMASYIMRLNRYAALLQVLAEELHLQEEVVSETRVDADNEGDAGSEAKAEDEEEEEVHTVTDLDELTLPPPHHKAASVGGSYAGRSGVTGASGTSRTALSLFSTSHGQSFWHSKTALSSVGITGEQAKETEHLTLIREKLAAVDPYTTEIIMRLFNARRVLDTIEGQISDLLAEPCPIELTDGVHAQGLVKALIATRRHTIEQLFDGLRNTTNEAIQTMVDTLHIPEPHEITSDMLGVHVPAAPAPKEEKAPSTEGEPPSEERDVSACDITLPVEGYYAQHLAGLKMVLLRALATVATIEGAAKAIARVTMMKPADFIKAAQKPIAEAAPPPVPTQTNRRRTGRGLLSRARTMLSVRRKKTGDTDTPKENGTGKKADFRM